MGVRSGSYRHRIELLKPKLGDDCLPLRDAFGSPTHETKVVQRPWCRILANDSDESVSTAINTQEVIRFELRYSKMYENAETKMSLKFQGDTFDITSAVNKLKLNEKTIITAIKRR